MIITFHGEGCFKIQTSGAVILTEDFTGKTSGRLKADILIKTTSNAFFPETENIIKGPGEYEIKGIEIRGFPFYTYLIMAENLKMAYLTDEGTRSFTANEKAAESFAGLDIIMIPAGEAAAKVVRQFNPKVILVSSGNAKDMEKELGVKAEALDKFVVKKKDIGEGMRLISLKS